jgi:hypothetical protein
MEEEDDDDDIDQDNGNGPAAVRRDKVSRRLMEPRTINSTR